jgi:hypothetical protein
VRGRDNEPESQLLFLDRYNVLFMLFTYFVPIIVMGYTYARVGIELWGSQSIGEATQRQLENIKSKRRVRSVSLLLYSKLSLILLFFSPSKVDSRVCTLPIPICMDGCYSIKRGGFSPIPFQNQQRKYVCTRNRKWVGYGIRI